MKKTQRILEMLAEGKDNDQIREEVGVSFTYISKLRNHGYNRKPQSDSWTKEEEEKLTHVYPFLCPSELSMLFNRSGNGIMYKARKMGLRKSPDYISHKKEMFCEVAKKREDTHYHEEKEVRKEIEEKLKYICPKQRTDRRHLDAMGKECGWGDNWEKLGNYGSIENYIA